MSMDGLLEAAHEPVFVPHLLLAGLERSKDSPCVYLGDRVLTGREVYEQISCYAHSNADGSFKNDSAVYNESVSPKLQGQNIFGRMAGQISTSLVPVSNAIDEE